MSVTKASITSGVRLSKTDCFLISSWCVRRIKAEALSMVDDRLIMRAKAKLTDIIAKTSKRVAFPDDERFEGIRWLR